MESIYIQEETLPAAWEKAVLACWAQGVRIPTQYDKEGDPNSRDVSAMIHVKNPTTDPCIHKAFPGGLEDLEKYRNEVVLGVHDHWIAPEEGKWEYTYSERMFKYRIPQNCPACEGKGEVLGPIGVMNCHECQGQKTQTINQVDKCVEMLKKCGFTRRAQIVTWQAWNDLGISDPACLQRLWLRVEENEGGDKKLNMNIHMRSNDAYKAAFMNMFAFIELQKVIASRLDVEVGEYIHVADSFHIYGSYFDEFENGFLKTIRERSFEERVWDYEFAIPMFIDGCDQLLTEADLPKNKHTAVARRKDELIRLGA